MARRGASNLISRGAGQNDSSSKRIIQLSKSLSWLLRHAAAKEGIPLQEDGYVFVDDVLRHRTFIHKYTIDDIHECVETNAKKRFGLKIDEATRKEMIRAHQGHSMEDVEIDMQEITDPSEFPIVLHGTYHRYWPSIQQNGLSKMKRTHIHFAPGFPKESGVISGMRSSCQLYIYVDLEKALQDGFKFFLSSNNVILCPGNENGILPPKYFSRVQDNQGKELPLPIDTFKRTTTS